MEKRKRHGPRPAMLSDEHLQTDEEAEGTVSDKEAAEPKWDFFDF